MTSAGILAVALAVLLTACSTTGAGQDARLPSEVKRFLVDRDGCDHFRGEEPYDPERAAFLDGQMKKLCTGTDAQLAALRRRYADRAEVIAVLSIYEDRIETHDPAL